MNKAYNGAPKPQISLTEAKKVLGTTSKGLSDEAILNLITQVETLTDIVVAHALDSKIQSALDISNNSSHTGL